MARRRRNRKQRVTRSTWRPNRRLRSPFLVYKDPNPSFVNSRRLRTTTYRVTKKQKQTRRLVIIPTTQQTKRTTSLPLYAGNKQFKKALICARRQQRKEVLHAQRRTGKSGQRSPRYNQHSKLHCTR